MPPEGKEGHLKSQKGRESDTGVPAMAQSEKGNDTVTLLDINL